jgi:antitoxin HigA-1
MDHDKDIPHPGLLLRSHVLPELGLTVTQGARDLAVTRQALHRLLAGQTGISPGMARRLEIFCGVSSRVWLGKQADYDLGQQKPVFALDNIISHSLSPKTLKKLGARDGG